jgi:PKD repeat protein
MSFRGCFQRAVAVLIVALAGVPAIAQADSLVYIKGQRVWISNPDGSQARPVTPSSPYWQWPSQSDNGTIVVSGGAPSDQASGNDKIYAFDQHGRSLLAKPIDTPGSVTLPGCGATYTTHFQVSPDGRTVAYQAAGACMPGASGGDTFIQPLNPSQSWTRVNPEDYVNPVWTLDSDHLFLTHNGPTVTSNQANYALTDLSSQSQPTGWTDPNIPDGYSYEGFTSHDGRLFALFLDDANNYIPPTPHHVRIHLETWATPVSGNSSDACTITLNPSKFTASGYPLIETMTFSSDDKTLMWSEDDGIWAANVSNPSSCGTPRLVIPAGQMPQLSPATLMPALPTASFSVSPTRPRAHSAAHFNAASSHETGGRIVTYRWSFGDGKTGLGRVTTHTFRRAGHYTVKLTVTDAHGARATAQKRITVRS